MDTAPYGSVELTKSISLTAAPGVYAGISVFASGVGITIATAGIKVVLRGLTINGQGGSAGIALVANSTLSIENCVIANFGSSGSGVFVNGPANAQIISTVIRDNDIGVFLSAGPTANISKSKILGSSITGILVQGSGVLNTSTVAISDTVVSEGAEGIKAVSTIGGVISRISVIRSTITNNSAGGILSLTGAAGTALVSVRSSSVTGNGSVGLDQDGAGATLETLGNNTCGRMASMSL